MYRHSTKAALSSSSPLPEGTSSSRGGTLEKPRTQLQSVLDSLRFRTASAITATIEGDRVLPQKLPPSAPGSLEHCEDACYWKWFVHTIVDDVNALRAQLDEAQVALQQRSQERREREQVIEHQDFLRAELAELEGQLVSLRVEAPQLRAEHARLEEQAKRSGLATLELQERKDKLSRELEADRAKQYSLVADAEEWERKAQEGRGAEWALQERTMVMKDNERVLQADLLKMTTERDQLRQEVDDLNALRERQNRRGRKRRPKKAP